MSTTTVVVVCLVGAGGALVRHELTGGRPLLRLHVVNVAGALLLGLAIGAGTTGTPLLAAVAGLGGLTSFSTWMVGSTLLGARAERRRAAVVALHVLIPTVVAVVAAAVGWSVGGVLATLGGATS